MAARDVVAAVTCDGCTGGCPCSPAPRRDNLYDSAHILHQPNDSRFATAHRRALGDLFRCEVGDCHMGPDANLYTATVRAPDGRQRTVVACVKHLELMAAQALSAVRLEPF